MFSGQLVEKMTYLLVPLINEVFTYLISERM